jgi:hypothetical protein
MLDAIATYQGNGAKESATKCGSRVDNDSRVTKLVGQQRTGNENKGAMTMNKSAAFQANNVNANQESAMIKSRIGISREFRGSVNSLDHERHSPVLGCDGRFPVVASFDQDSETDREQVIAKAIRNADRIAFRCGSRSVLEFKVVNGCTGFTAIRYTLKANQFQADEDHLSFRDGSVTSYGEAAPLWRELETLALSGLGYLSNNEVGYHRSRFSEGQEFEHDYSNCGLPLRVRTDDLKSRDLTAIDGWQARELGEDTEDNGASDLLEDDIDVVCSWLRYWEAKVEANVEDQRAELAAANKALFAGADSDEDEENAPRKRGRPRLSDKKQARAEARMLENLSVPPVKLRGMALAWPDQGSLSLKGFRG